MRKENISFLSFPHAFSGNPFSEISVFRKFSGSEIINIMQKINICNILFYLKLISL